MSTFPVEEPLGHFCHNFKSICLIPNDSVNPYSMTMIKGVSDYQIVYLSPERLEEQKYVLIDKSSCE